MIASSTFSHLRNIKILLLSMCAVFALPIKCCVICQNTSILPILKQLENIFVIFVRLRLESEAVRKLPRILFQPLAHTPPLLPL